VNIEGIKSGYLGGTFDPIHLGHLIIAQDVLEKLNLDRVYFVPASQNPLKDEPPTCLNEDRLKMVDLALEEDSRFERLDCELETGGKSYTIDTAEQLYTQNDEQPVLWIIGSDNIDDLPHWHRIDELAEIVEFICVARPGYSVEKLPEIPRLNLRFVEGHPIEISSSEIRNRVKMGNNIDLFLPPKVFNYIQTNNLYR
jgi:nicotinate-nucleotide adenylyltransferase